MRQNCIAFDRILQDDRRSSGGRSGTGERANTVSALLGLAWATGFAVWLDRHHPSVGQWIFASTLILMNLASITYHALPAGSAKQAARAADRIAIFLLIAGTYSAFSLGALWKGCGPLLLKVEWGMAIVGVLFVATGGIRRQKLSNALYLVMGWMGLAFGHAIARDMAPSAVAWLLTGGVVYTLGVVFYCAKRLPYSHMIWHFFVIAGSMCHAMAVIESR